MAVAGSTKKRKLEENMNKRLERGKKKMEAKALRQARKMKEKERA
jgi:hypothetical protein